MTLPGLSETNHRILAQRHQLFFAVEMIPPAPQLRPSRRDQQKKPFPVVDFERLLSGLACPNRSIRQSHFPAPEFYFARYPTFPGLRTPQYTPPLEWVPDAPLGTHVNA